MLKLTVRVLCCLAVSGIGRAMGAEPVAATKPAATRSAATRPAVSELKGLLGQLDADEWATRDGAAARIALLGEAARPELERRLKGTEDPDLRQRMEGLLAALDEARKFGATPVTLNLRDVSAREALTALASQAGVTFAPEPETLWTGDAEPPRVTLACEREPFWSCLQQICGQAKLGFVKSARDAPVQLARISPNVPDGPWAVAGPFLLKVKRIERTRHVEFDGPRDQDATSGGRISLFAWAEPKLARGSWAIERVDELTTDLGPQPFDRGDLTGGGRIGSASWGTMTFPADLRGSRITRLRATARFTVIVRTQTLEVDRVLASGKTERILGGFAFQLSDVNKVVGDQYVYTIEVTRGERSTEEFNTFRQVLDQSQPNLVDAAGQALWFQSGSGSHGPGTWTQTNQVTREALRGVKVGEPARFVWEVPVETKTVRLPVEFREMPLP